jgi:transmembrane secretion effector
VAVTHAVMDVAPLRSSRQFRRLWIGRACSGLGSQLTLVAVMYQVWQMTGSTVWTGAVGLAQAIPIVAFGLVAGSLVDRTDRRRFYLVTTSGQAIFVAAGGAGVHRPSAGDRCAGAGRLAVRVRRRWWPGVAHVHSAVACQGSAGRRAGAGTVRVPRTPSVQFMRHVRTRGGCLRGGRADGC